MEEQPKTQPPTAAELRVPDDLMAQLHDANQRFHEAKVALDQTTNDSAFRQTGQYAQLMEKFRKAEKELEEIDRKIKATPASKTTSAKPPAHPSPTNP